jgi:hypothetical protein
VIHSIDSLKLAQELERQLSRESGVWSRESKQVNVLVEVNASEETTKYGIKPEEAAGMVRAIRELPHLRVTGLMTMAPLVEDPELARSYFRHLRELRDHVNSALQTPDSRLTDLSMGMTQDYEVAIEEGATMVRIGTAIFGART